MFGIDVPARTDTGRRLSVIAIEAGLYIHFTEERPELRMIALIPPYVRSRILRLKQVNNRIVIIKCCIISPPLSLALLYCTFFPLPIVFTYWLIYYY